MRRFLTGNIGSMAEVVFSAFGMNEKVFGNITEIAENALILESNGDVIAGSIENILFVRILKASEHTKESLSEPETQTANASDISPNSTIVVPTLNTSDKRSQTVFGV